MKEGWVWLVGRASPREPLQDLAWEAPGFLHRGVEGHSLIVGGLGVLRGCPCSWVYSKHTVQLKSGMCLAWLMRLRAHGKASQSRLFGPPLTLGAALEGEAGSHVIRLPF